MMNNAPQYKDNGVAQCWDCKHCKRQILRTIKNYSGVKMQVWLPECRVMGLLMTEVYGRCPKRAPIFGGGEQ